MMRADAAPALTQPIPEHHAKLLTAYATTLYGPDPDFDLGALFIWDYKTNPHLTIEGAALAETAGSCTIMPGHAGHRAEWLAEVHWSPKGYRSLMAISTCGELSVWQD